ncbi:class I SAM-dependent methyltransferase [Acinetobacter sp.]|uniref:class I SAM-dependent methyltransferase n=1 Tax=Acinetobacter sp. TaxID=472 RepID=UPI002FD90048
MLKNKDSYLKQVISSHRLEVFEENRNFILNNPLSLSIHDLSRIAELTNSHQESTAAYYTDPMTVSALCQNLPEFHQKAIRILEPSVGVGNILREVIAKYKDSVESIEVDAFDINHHSLEICEILMDKTFGPLTNIKINYIHDDFLQYQFHQHYDLVVGNPPFIKIKGKYRENLRTELNNPVADNSAAFFLDKAIGLAQHVALILPKYFLHNMDFSVSREKIKQLAINKIVDFGETGFKGVLIETICLFIHTQAVLEKSSTQVISIPKKINILQNQADITQSAFPNWLIYIDKSFQKLAAKMQFGIFTVFRDRQITSKILKPTGDIWVIKSKNIPRTGEAIYHIEDDAFIDQEHLSKLAVEQYLERDDVFLSPNMTYYPRVVQKPKGCIVNGSVAIFELKADISISEEDLLFFASAEFEAFYRIARNHSTRSLNIDNIAIFYFGKRQHRV